MGETGTTDARGYRLQSIDLVRGIAIVIMALDHTRDFFSDARFDLMDPSQTTLAIFLTRWVTHICAPAFVFLAGVSAGLMAARKPTAALSMFLAKRGLWLIFVEMVIVALAWNFNVTGTEQIGGQVMILMQVIWAIGASMLALALIVWLPARAILPLGLIIVFGHNLLDDIWPQSGFPDSSGPFWHALHSLVVVNVGPLSLFFAYPILPWIGVMTLGYGAAQIFGWHEMLRQRALLRLGTIAIVLFLVLRLLNWYGEPNAWSGQETGFDGTLISFLNTTKYPPSLQYLLMTLGPTLILLAYAGRWRGFFANALVTFGRVPFLFYIAHLYLLHAAAVVFGVLVQDVPASALTTGFMFFPPEFGIGLPGVYVAWVLVVVVLYFPCAWFAGVKKRRKDWWLSYL
jgi:uncharacterized membrane protein